MLHDSRSPFFRSPGGAVPQGTAVTLSLYAPGFTKAYLRLWDGREHITEMIPGERCFSAQVSRAEPCLLCYYFLLEKQDGQTLYYLNAPDMLGGEGELTAVCDTLRSFCITFYSQDYKTPAWCADAVMYQIFPDRFNASLSAAGRGKSLERRMHKDWASAPEYRESPGKDYYAADDFYGGDFAGIEQKLDYLAAMGVNTVYLNPVFKAYSNHRYDTGDYENTDPLLGTNEEFAHMCTKAHECGIRIILDGVFSHTGSDSRYFNKNGTYPDVGAACSKSSPYYPWYSFEHYPDKYACWWGVWSLPCVKETEPSYMDYILRSPDAIIKRWLRAGASGWRLDVAEELPDEFLFELRRQVKNERPDALIIGEVWEDASRKESYSRLRPYLQGAQLDSVMNYPLRSALLEYLQYGNAALFVRRVESLKENYPPQSFACTMNFVSTHDTVRACTALGGAPEGLTREEAAHFTLSPLAEIRARELEELAYAILFMLPGIPCIYYGDEDYMQGCSDPFNRASKQWNTAGFQKLIAEMSRIRRTLGAELRLCAAGSALCIQRGSGQDKVVGIINPSDDPLEQILDFSLTDGGEILLSNGVCELKQREQGVYLWLDPRSFCVINGHKMH